MVFRSEASNRRSLPPAASSEPVADLTRTAVAISRFAVRSAPSVISELSVTMIVVRKQPTSFLLIGVYEKNVSCLRVSPATEFLSAAIERKIGPHDIRSFDDR